MPLIPVVASRAGNITKKCAEPCICAFSRAVSQRLASLVSHCSVKNLLELAELGQQSRAAFREVQGTSVREESLVPEVRASAELWLLWSAGLLCLSMVLHKHYIFK
jgi:hypothetical protein